MPILPLTATQTAPLLPLVLAKIARTPRARLSILYHLQPRCGPTRCASPKEPPAQQPRPLHPAEADNRQRWNVGALVQPLGRRALGEALLVDRLIAGGILGSTLKILDCQCLPDPADAPHAGQRIDVIA